MAPVLTTTEKLSYVTKEIDNLLDMLDGAEDCKWIYQALIHLAVLYRDLGNNWPVQVENLEKWVQELQTLDPLRAKRWHDLKASLGIH